MITFKYNIVIPVIFWELATGWNNAYNITYRARNMKESITNTLFVTGTDTGVGKTFFCARMLEFLRTRQISAGYQKWVATGTGEEIPEDLARCLAAAGLLPEPELTGLQVPYKFKYPASPHLAAEMEDRTVAAEVVGEKYRTLAAGYELLIVEGVGGLMVPLRRDLLLADLLEQLKPLTLVVARSGLGTLNHTLLTLEVMRQRGIPILGVVLSDPETGRDETVVQDNIRTIAECGRTRVFGRLPWQPDPEKAKKEFIPVGRAIWTELRQSP